jgi:hypothetical protein
MGVSKKVGKPGSPIPIGQLGLECWPYPLPARLGPVISRRAVTASGQCRGAGAIRCSRAGGRYLRTLNPVDATVEAWARVVPTSSLQSTASPRSRVEMRPVYLDSAIVRRHPSLGSK